MSFEETKELKRRVRFKCRNCLRAGGRIKSQGINIDCARLRGCARDYMRLIPFASSLFGIRGFKRKGKLTYR
jgi:hypothetical protein